MKNDELDQAFERLQRVLPRPLARILRWLHDPKSRWVRIPLGIVFIGASFFWFLPVVGVEFLPIGLLLIAQDVPFLRRPVGKMVLWCLDKFEELKQWWKTRRGTRPTRRRGD
jgi:hypothetical protein